MLENPNSTYFTYRR